LTDRIAGFLYRYSTFFQLEGKYFIPNDRQTDKPAIIDDTQGPILKGIKG